MAWLKSLIGNLAAIRIPTLYNATTDSYDAIKGSNGSVNVAITGSLSILLDITAAWANSAAVNTAVNLDIPLPSDVHGEGLYQITITNPSAVTAITAKVKNKETLGTAKYPLLSTISTPVSTPDGKVTVVQGLFGEAARITLSNDTVLGVADGFSAYVRVRKL
ncbi:MAG: hypothetical protein ACYCVD_04180 [Desulfitobacteriaceae bacterium]